MFLVSVVACGSSSGTGGVTSVAGNKSLATISPADATQLCIDSINYASRNIPKSDLCKRVGYAAAAQAFALQPGTATDTVVQMVCTTAVNQCNSASSDAGAGGCNIGTTSSCAATATVDEYSKCVSDTVATLKAGLQSFPACSEITVASLAASVDGGAGTPPPASCTKLMSDCPNISLP
jgi:hypothetical protein